MAAASNLKNMALCLFGTCLICSAVLAGVYALTAAPIAETNAAILKASISKVLPEGGEISALALLAGFVYLLVRKVIRPHITLSIWAAVAVTSLIFWLADPSRFTDPVFNLLSGGMILGSCFMATDYVTSPMSVKGGIVFGIGIGFITMMIRYFGSYPEGMSFAILIMNSTVPLINRWFHQKKYGRK